MFVLLVFLVGGVVWGWCLILGPQFGGGFPQCGWSILVVEFLEFGGI